MTNITETDLTRLGFEHQETWEDDDYYFTKEFGEEHGLCLITNCKSELKDGWVVEFFDNSGTKPIKSLELLEEFINIMNKIQKMPTEVTYHNRYNDRIIFESVDDSIVMTIPDDAVDYVRVGHYDDSPYDECTNFSMVDPSGGPFIATRKYDGIVSATNMGNFHTSWEGLLVKDIERIGPGKYKLIVDRNED